MKKMNRSSIEWRLTVLLAIRLATVTLAWGQESADKVFMWEAGENYQRFWHQSINCGRPSQPGGANNTRGSRVNFGVTSQQRYPGTRSVEFWTNSNYEERCNQNHSAERAEMHSNEPYRGLGVREGQHVWVGFSDMYTAVDYSHSATLLQFRNNCGSGSPSTEIKIKPGGMMLLQTPGKKTDIIKLEENVWYDWVIEIKYSKRGDGFVKIWAWNTRNTASENYDYNKPTIEYRGRTMRDGDNCPHIRWGVYRWASGDKKPNQIPENDRFFVKYLGPVRFKLGRDLGAAGFRAVVPRSPDGRDLPPLVYEEEEEVEEQPVERETYIENSVPVAPCGAVENLAFNKQTSQSSTYGFGSPDRAVDNDLSTDRGPWSNGSITHTQHEKEAWWEVDLGTEYTLAQINYTGRTDCCKDRLQNAYVMVSKDPFPSSSLEDNLNDPSIWRELVSEYPDPTIQVETGEISGRYVRIQLQETFPVSLANVQVYGCPSTAVSPGLPNSGDTNGNSFEDTEDEVLRIEEIPIKFYPNIATDFLYIEMERPAAVRISDFNGVTYMELKLPSGKQKIDIARLANGVYLIQRYYGDTRSYGKFIVQR
ncbi:MAG: heparin lyase I family protein [Bacteroidota bacterium]